MKEIWKDIKDYENFYQVSNLGNVRSLDRVLNNRFGKYIKKGTLMTVNNSNRYPMVLLFINWKFKCVKIHRLVAEAFIPNPNNKPEVNHINGIRTDNRVENLEWVTRCENMQHAKKNGLRPDFKGENNPASILDHKKVFEIRNRYSSEKISMRKLAKEYNVCATTICGIINNNFWDVKKAS